jgi:hypothetical protein
MFVESAVKSKICEAAFSLVPNDETELYNKRRSTIVKTKEIGFII